ncbi:MAG: ribonuclease P protein component [Lentimicrobiaceae bacterium]|nr:ribonuclease P protein component [Lentimicrobiaceae bacterium]
MPPAADNKLKRSFQKRDRLKSSVEIEDLYRENQFIVSYPLKCYYSFSDRKEKSSILQVAFAVPKKKFKHAIDRNTLKRRMRESYRLNYQTMFESIINQNEKQLKFFIIYIGNEILNYACIDKALKEALFFFIN